MRASAARARPAGAREAGNREAWQRLAEADPVVRDVRPAGDVLPGMESARVLTSGAPLPWSA